MPFKLDVNKYYTPHVVTRETNSPTAAHPGHKRRLKWVPGAWGYMLGHSALINMVD